MDSVHSKPDALNFSRAGLLPRQFQQLCLALIVFTPKVLLLREVDEYFCIALKYYLTKRIYLVTGSIQLAKDSVPFF